MAKLKTIEDFFEQQDGAYSQLLRTINQFVVATWPEVEVQFKWSCPLYYYKGSVCYLNIMAKGTTVYLAFNRGFELSNESGLLNTDGNTTMVKKINIASLENLQENQDAIRSTLLEAFYLNHTNPLVFWSSKK
jgi:hypothetical protein